MCAFVVERSGLSLGVGLHQETSEVGNHAVYLLGLGLPPRLHLAVQRIGGLQRLATVESLGRHRHR